MVVHSPFYCEYEVITIGERTFVNVDAVVLGVTPIAIGAAGVRRVLRAIDGRDHIEVPII